MMLLVPAPRARPALPYLRVRCWPREKSSQRRHQTIFDWVRQMINQVRCWSPRRRLLLFGGGFATVSLVLACVKSQVAIVSPLRWDAGTPLPAGDPTPQAGAAANPPFELVRDPRNRPDSGTALMSHGYPTFADCLASVRCHL